MKIFTKFIIPGGGGSSVFEITVWDFCSCFTKSLYLIIRRWDIIQRHGLDYR